jgi:tRNA threonylcarbamoyladenosine biosynthesis protein TsaE
VSGPGAEAAPPADEPFLICSHSAAETQRIGQALGAALRSAPDAESASTAITLTGPLGGGKTCLMQGLARGLGVAGAVRSPTFTLIHEHRGPVPLHHVDLYRIAAADLDALGLEEIIDRQGVTAIEWGERAEGLVPPEHLQIELQFGRDACDRQVRMIPRGRRYEQLLAAVRACASWR